MQFDISRIRPFTPHSSPSGWYHTFIIKLRTKLCKRTLPSARLARLSLQPSPSPLVSMSDWRL